jgi:hypothetical protein
VESAKFLGDSASIAIDALCLYRRTSGAWLALCPARFIEDEMTPSKIANCVRSLLLCACLGVSGCGAGDTDALAREVREDIAKKFASDPATAGIKVGALTLAHRGGNDYRGILEVGEGGERENLTVEVTFDGSTMVWQVIP